MTLQCNVQRLYETGINKIFFSKIVIVIIFSWLAGVASANDYMIINHDVTGSGSIDKIRLIDEGREFYTLSVTSKGKEILRNESLVPKLMRNGGGLEIFQGLSVVDQSLSLRYRFCGPSTGVCYDRSIIGSLEDGQFFFSREETVAAAGELALSGIFYQRPAIPFASLTYQFLLENNHNAGELFSRTYGRCVTGLKGDSLTIISDELEKETPSSWVLEKGCVTPAFVFALSAQNYLSSKAVSRYLDLSQ